MSTGILIPSLATTGSGIGKLYFVAEPVTRLGKSVNFLPPLTSNEVANWLDMPLAGLTL